MSDNLNPWGRVCIVIAARNEAWNIGGVVRQARRYGHVLVVDNASGDLTAAKARVAGASLLIHAKDTHIKQSYIDGFVWALERDYQKIVQLDAGLSFDPEQIPDLLRVDADLVIGQRRNRDRRLLSLAGSWLARVLLGMPFKDLSSGFRCWTRQTLIHLDLQGVFDNLQCRAHGFQIELLHAAYSRGLHIEAVPVSYEPGRTSSNPQVAWEALRAVWGLLMADLREWRRR